MTIKNIDTECNKEREKYNKVRLHKTYKEQFNN